MNPTALEALADALLYEGYLLYPYRTSALKNRFRWLFGVVVPPSFAAQNGSDPWTLQTECLVIGDSKTMLEAKVRFLRCADASAATPEEVAVASEVAPLLASAQRVPFTRAPAIEGAVELSACPAGEGVLRLGLSVQNLSAAPAHVSRREDILAFSLLSMHALLSVRGGEFVSLLDPPEVCREAASDCRQNGLWPVLIGEQGRRDAMLAAPIILEDYPRVAPESPGDLFDATEIDELLTLRILTLTDAEKQEMAAADDRTRALLQRTEALTDVQRSGLHGMIRSKRRDCQAGDRVRLRPRNRADVFDLALADRTAVIAAVEQDFEGQVHFAVTVEDDPGRDLGLQGQPGHRFYFRPDEVELLDDGWNGP
jgi:hypothetical protein